MDLKSGKRAKQNRMGSITQPLQFLPRAEKDLEWASWNMDWLEWNGLKQIRDSARRLLKNYKLAKGIIDRSDYIVEKDNEAADMIDILTREDNSAMELKFYPIIPNIINVLCSEFSKRNTKVTFLGVDEYSYNEMMEEKRAQIENVLMQNASQKLAMKLQEQMDPNDPEAMQQMQEQLSPENIKSLPEIQEFFDKSYKSVVEQWASHQWKADTERFSLDELEERGFRDMLITDREFWHFRMMEDDYDIELWNPVTTFYHKSPENRYISQGDWVGKVDMMTTADVIDKYGYLMNEEQLENLEALYPVRAAGYPITGYQNDGSYYDATKSHDWNVNQPGLAYRQYMSMYESGFNGGDVIDSIFSESEDYYPMGSAYTLRVTTSYWKSQRKLYYLTKVTETGEIITDTVDETYKITDQPVYNTTLIREKSGENLLFGEHLEALWINEVYGGVKIGPNRPSFFGMNNPGELSPIYLGIDKKRPGPLRFQFKGDKSLYGSKLPVEGAVFSDRNTRSSSLVDMAKPHQIGYNIVNNQIADILIDELGTVILIDQNTLPRHSLGEDWGKGNLSKAYVAMKNFQMLPLDMSMENMQGQSAFSHFQTLNLEQTNRLMTRVQLATHFKNQCFETIGLTPQRLGQQIGQTNTATGVEQAVIGSYAQTESLFIQHCDYLMPRVHTMRTDLAQFYQSRKPSIRLQYLTSADEKVNFEINGTDLLLRDINVFASTKANHRAIVEKMKAMLERDNTTGASVYDLGNIMQAESLAELNVALKSAEKKAQQQAGAQQEAEQKMHEQEMQTRLAEMKMEQDHESIENEKNRRRDVLVAEIRAAGYGAMQDIDENKQSDFIDALEDIKRSTEFAETMGMESTKEQNKVRESQMKAEIEREKIDAQLKMKNVDLQIARQNKNKFDKKPETKKKKK